MPREAGPTGARAVACSLNIGGVLWICALFACGVLAAATAAGCQAFLLGSASCLGSGPAQLMPRLRRPAICDS